MGIYYLGSDSLAKGLDRPIRLKLFCLTPNAEIRYTLDGSEPNSNSIKYSDPGIQLNGTAVVKAIAFKNSHSSTTLSYPLNFQVQTCTVTRKAGGGGDLPYWLSFSSESPNAEIHFKRNGIPTIKDSIFKDSLLVNNLSADSLIQAIAVNRSNSAISQSKACGYAINWNPRWDNTGEYGFVFDKRDGKYYKTVKIGTQNWFAQNLNFGYASSTCAGFNGYEAGKMDFVTMSCLYGRQYNWAEAMMLDSVFNYKYSAITGIQQGVCPQGWHVPDSSEYNLLNAYFMNHKAAKHWFRPLESGYQFWTANEEPDLLLSANKLLSYAVVEYGLTHSTLLEKTHRKPVRCIMN